MFVLSVCPHGMNNLALTGPIFVKLYIGHKFYFILPAGETKPSSGSHSVAALDLTPPPFGLHFFDLSIHLTPNGVQPRQCSFFIATSPPPPLSLLLVISCIALRPDFGPWPSR